MRGRARLLGAACACLLAGSVAAGQGRFRAGVELVSLNVTVTDGTKYVTGLEQDDFEVFEDGAKQAITFFSRVQQPIALAVLLDTSNSMEEKLATAQEAAIGFVRRMRKDDTMEVIDFNSQVRIPQPFTADTAALERAIRQTTVNGSTSLYNAIYVSLRELSKQRAVSADDIRRQAIVVLSDGDDTTSLVSYDDLMELAKQSGIGIYTITLRSKYLVTQAAQRGHSYFSQSEYGMKALAQETGARSFFPMDVSELPTIYSAIAEELATQYALGYASKNPKADGAYRRVIVRVADPPGTRTRTRAGYLAARAAARIAGTN